MGVAKNCAYAETSSPCRYRHIHSAHIIHLDAPVPSLWVYIFSSLSDVELMAEAQTSPEMLETLAPILHGLIALWGLLDCFWGFRIFRFTVRILAAVMVASVGASIALHYFPGSLLALGGFAVGGLIVGALLGWYLYKVGVFILGFFTGTLIAAPFVGHVAPQWEWVVLAGGGLVIGVLSVLLVNIMIMAGTALTGGFRLVFGTAYYFGGPSLIVATTNPGGATFVVQDHPMLFAGTLGFAAVGFLLQWNAHRKSKGED